MEWSEYFYDKKMKRKNEGKCKKEGKELKKEQDGKNKEMVRRGLRSEFP